MWHLFPPHNKTDTSIAAAKSIAPEMNNLEQLTISIIAKAGSDGMTNEEISDASRWYGRHMSLQCVCARANKLISAGKIEDSGNRRRGKSGRAARVLTIKKES